MRHTTGGLILVAALSAAIAACSTSDNQCHGDLAEVGADCPRTFDGTMAAIPPCPAGRYWVARAFDCGDLIRLSVSFGLGGFTCVYDGSSHQLVGASQVTDYPAYCDNTSFSLPAGRVPASTACGMDPIAEIDCATQL